MPTVCKNVELKILWYITEFAYILKVKIFK